MRNAANAIGADLRILFVEDEPMDVLGEQHALKRDGLEFASRVAVSEVEPTHHLIDFMPDVVLCDYTMPGFSGPRAIDTCTPLAALDPHTHGVGIDRR